MNLWYQILQVQNNNGGEINTFDILCRVGIKYICLQKKHLQVSLAKLCWPRTDWDLALILFDTWSGMLDLIVTNYLYKRGTWIIGSNNLVWSTRNENNITQARTEKKCWQKYNVHWATQKTEIRHTDSVRRFTRWRTWSYALQK